MVGYFFLHYKEGIVFMEVKLMYIDKNKEFSCYEQYLPLISKRRKDKISRFYFDKDKTVSLLTGLLIRNEISQRLGIIPSDIEFGYGEHGKPYVLNSCDYHFSVSHSGNAIVFVGDSFPVGIDIEQIADENLKMAKRFFTCNEYEYTINSKQLNIAFYKIWTSKEAYVKMLGLGLSKPLKSFDVLNESINCSFVTKRATEYLITVCSEKTVINDIKIEELPIERLLR